MVGIYIFFWGGNNIFRCELKNLLLLILPSPISGCSEEFPRLFSSLDASTLPTVPTMGISEPSRESQAGKWATYKLRLGSKLSVHNMGVGSKAFSLSMFLLH